MAIPKERLEELQNKVGLDPEEAQELFAHITELEALTVASAEIAEGTLYGTEEAIQGLKRTLKAGVELARALTKKAAD